MDIYLLISFFLFYIDYLVKRVRKLGDKLVSEYVIIIILILIMAFYILNFNNFFLSCAGDYLFIGDFLVNFFRIFLLVGIVIYFYIGVVRKLFFPKVENLFIIFFCCIMFLISLIIFDLFLLSLVIEVISLCLYILAIGDSRTIKASEAGLKYYILGIIASLFFLYGLSFIYGFFGTLNLSKIIVLVNLDLIFYDNEIIKFFLFFGICFIIGAFLFKLGIVPFHVWLIDVYVGIPFHIYIFFTLFPKIIFSVLIFKLYIIFIKLVGINLNYILFLSGLSSIVIGGLGMFGAATLRRFFAYSSISHMGFIIVGISMNTLFSFISILIYLIIYIILMFGIFLINLFLNMERIGFDSIYDLRVLRNSSLKLSLYFLLIIFSFAGIPPFLGFWAKILILLNLFTENSFFGLLSCTIILGVNVIGIFAYIRLIAILFFDETRLSNIEYVKNFLGAKMIIFVSFINLVGVFGSDKSLNFLIRLLINFLICYI